MLTHLFTIKLYTAAPPLLYAFFLPTQCCALFAVGHARMLVRTDQGLMPAALVAKAGERPMTAYLLQVIEQGLYALTLHRAESGLDATSCRVHID